jgi:hypothetical protein
MHRVQAGAGWRSPPSRGASQEGRGVMVRNAAASMASVAGAECCHKDTFSSFPRSSGLCSRRSERSRSWDAQNGTSDQGEHSPSRLCVALAYPVSLSQGALSRSGSFTAALRGLRRHPASRTQDRQLLSERRPRRGRPGNIRISGLTAAVQTFSDTIGRAQRPVTPAALSSRWWLQPLCLPWPCGPLVRAGLAVLCLQAVLLCGRSVGRRISLRSAT